MASSPTYTLHTLSFYLVAACRPHLPLPSLSPPSLARHAASPTVGNVNGLSLLGVVAPSQASQANPWRPLRRVRGGGHTHGVRHSLWGGKREENDVKG